jgi:prevent-host-death family protein
MTIHVSIKEAKNRLSELVRFIEAGERVVLTRRGEAVAEIGPPAPRRGGANFEALRKWKQERGIEQIVTYVAPDFDDPLPEDFLITPNSE